MLLRLAEVGGVQAMRRGLGCWFLVLIYAISHRDFKKGLFDSASFKFTLEGSLAFNK